MAGVAEAVGARAGQGGAGDAAAAAAPGRGAAGGDGARDLSSGGPAVDPGVLTTVAQACRDTERLEFGYSAADGTRPQRLVEPFRLVPLGPALVPRRLRPAPARLAQLPPRPARRARPTGARFRPRELPAEDAAAFVRAGLRNLPTSYEVEVLVEAPADDIRARIGRWATSRRWGRAVPRCG